MCTVSMIIDHYTPKFPNYPYNPNVTPWTIPYGEPEWFKDFKELVEKARKYDKEHNQKDCEVDEKVLLVRKLIKQLGLEDIFKETKDE